MIIDAKTVATEFQESLVRQVGQLKFERGVIPGLAVVLVGDDPTSIVYVRNKIRQTDAVGMLSRAYKLEADTTQDELLTILDKLNKDSEIHGILVQMPLPTHIDEEKVIATIDPDKDVDGFHAMNSGRLLNGEQGTLIPCAPQVCVMLAKKHLGEDLSDKNAIVIGRSNIVGKPVALLFLQENCTVTVAHSHTINLPELCRQADIVIAAVCSPKMVEADWIKPGATVIDVGINRLEDGGLVGDVDYDAILPIAGGITSVPDGVGQISIACLLKKTLESANRFSVQK